MLKLVHEKKVTGQKRLKVLFGALLRETEAHAYTYKSVATLHQGAPGQTSNDLAGRSTALASPSLALRIAFLR